MSLVSGKNYTTEFTSRKNMIINGNLDFWQRGTSFAAAASGIVTADRFKYYKTGTMVHTLSQSTDVPTYAESGLKSNYSLLADCTTADTSVAAGDYCLYEYNIEGYDYAQIAGNNATLSFWVKGTKTGTHCIVFRNSGYDRAYVVEYTVDVTDTWEKKTITVPLTETGGTWDYTNGAGLKIGFVLMSGTTRHTTANTWQSGSDYLSTSNQVNACDNVANNFRIAQVQLEAGIEATDFERRHYADELALCQRYYEKSYSIGVVPATATSEGSITLNAGTISNSEFIKNAEFKVTKRSQPTITLYGTTTANTAGNILQTSVGAVTATANRVGCHGFTTVNSSGVSKSGRLEWHFTADAEL